MSDFEFGEERVDAAIMVLEDMAECSARLGRNFMRLAMLLGWEEDTPEPSVELPPPVSSEELERWFRRPLDGE